MEQIIDNEIRFRAAKAYPILTEIAPENDIKNAQFLAYIKGATEQKKIDIEKADRWLRKHLPRVISNYPLDDKRTDMLNEDMREEFIKAMEQ